MNILIETRPNKWILFLSPRSIRSTMMTFIARLAERGPVRVLDSGGHFDGYLISRLLHGRANMRERISLSHTFTCHQVFDWLEKADALPAPYIMLDFLRTFYDQSIPFDERCKLLERCTLHLGRLSEPAGGVVSVQPPTVPTPGADTLLHILQSAASNTWVQQIYPQAPRPLRLFN